MGNLIDFLTQKPVSDITEEVKLYTRPEYGEMVFKVRAMDGEDFSEYQKQCSTIDKKGNPHFDTKKYNDLVIVNHCIEPDFKDAEVLKRAGVTTSSQLINKYLKAGEIAELSQKIADISGFDRDINEVKEEAKN